jgi:hypothetical protein
VLEERSESELEAMILHAFSEGKAMTWRQALVLIRERHPRCHKRLVTCFSHAPSRYSSSLPFVFVNMKSIVAGNFVELVLNLDEIGSSDWEDCKPRKEMASKRSYRVMLIRECHENIDT